MNCKKITAFLLCALLAVPFAGCKKALPAEGGTPSAAQSGAASAAELKPEAGATLKFRTGGTADTAFAKAAAANFEKKYGVKVTVEEGGLYDTQKIALEGPSGKGPDVFICPHDKTAECIKSGYFLPLDPSIIKKLNDEVLPICMKTVTSGGKCYGVPVSVETYVLFYNKKLVKTPITTFEQLAKEAKAYNNPKKNKFYYLFESTGSPMYTMLSTYGFQLFGKDGTDSDHPGFDTPAFEKGLEVLQKYHKIIPISSGDLGNTDFLDTQFENGNTAYIMSGPWDVQTFRKAGVDLGAVPLPTLDGHQQKSFAFIQNAHVSAYTKYPKAAQLFAESLISPESAELLYTKASKITARKDAASLKGLANDEVLQAIIKAFGNSNPMPSSKRISYFWTISNDICTAVFDGKITPAQGAKKAQDEWNSLVKVES